MAGVKQGTFTCVGWQVTPCDPIWQVTSRSFEVGFPRKSYIGLYLLALTSNPKQGDICPSLTKKNLHIKQSITSTLYLHCLETDVFPCSIHVFYILPDSILQADCDGPLLLSSSEVHCIACSAFLPCVVHHQTCYINCIFTYNDVICT